VRTQGAAKGGGLVDHRASHHVRLSRDVEGG
jgi:hypothetical protein